MRVWMVEELEYRALDGSIGVDWMITDGQRCYADAA